MMASVRLARRRAFRMGGPAVPEGSPASEERSMGDGGSPMRYAQQLWVAS